MKVRGPSGLLRSGREEKEHQECLEPPPPPHSLFPNLLRGTGARPRGSITCWLPCRLVQVGTCAWRGRRGQPRVSRGAELPAPAKQPAPLRSRPRVCFSPAIAEPTSSPPPPGSPPSLSLPRPGTDRRARFPSSSSQPPSPLPAAPKESAISSSPHTPCSAPPALPYHHAPPFWLASPLALLLAAPPFLSGMPGGPRLPQRHPRASSPVLPR